VAFVGFAEAATGLTISTWRARQDNDNATVSPGVVGANHAFKVVILEALWLCSSEEDLESVYRRLCVSLQSSLNSDDVLKAKTYPLVASTPEPKATLGAVEIS
jgi:hypothetical protein